MIVAEEMDETLGTTSNERSWQPDHGWVKLATLVKKGARPENRAWLQELGKLLAYVEEAYPKQKQQQDANVEVGRLSPAQQKELSQICENTTGIVKVCHAHAPIVRACLAILLHLAHPPRNGWSIALDQKNIVRLLRALPSNLSDTDVVCDLLQLILHVQAVNMRLLCSLELASIFQLPLNWKGPESGQRSSGTDARPQSPLHNSELSEPPASKRKQPLDLSQGEVFSISYQCLCTLNHLHGNNDVVLLVCQVMQTLCSRAQTLYAKIMAHQVDIGLIDRLLEVFQEKADIYVYNGCVTDSLAKTLDTLLHTVMKLLSVCKYHRLDCRRYQELATGPMLAALWPCLEHVRTLGLVATFDPKDGSLLSNLFRFCLFVPVRTQAGDRDVVAFSVKLVEMCRLHFRAYLASALRFAYGVGSALPQADWVKSFRLKKEASLHVVVMKCLDGGHVQDDTVLKESLRILRSLVSDPLWNEDLFGSGVLETLSTLASRLCTSDAYAGLMLDLVRIGFQLTCCSLQQRKRFVEKKFVNVLRLALMNHVQSWSIVRCALGSLSMLFRVEQVVIAAHHLKMAPVLIEAVQAHGSGETKQRYLHNAVAHMACIGIPHQPRSMPAEKSDRSTGITSPATSLQHVGDRALPLTNGDSQLTYAPHVGNGTSPPVPVRTHCESPVSAAVCNSDGMSRDQPFCPPPPEQAVAVGQAALVVSRLHGMACHACSTCSGSTTNSLELILTANQLSVEMYERLTMRGWFRRGSVPLSHYRHIHHPDCGDYETRTEVRQFDPNTSNTYKRVLRRAKRAGVTVETVRPQVNAEAFEMYNRYQHGKHGKVLKAAEGYGNHIVDTPLVAETRDGIPYGTVHQLYRMDGRLIGVGVLDVLPHCVISVYMFYDIVCRDVAKLSLGVYAVLQEIEYAKKLNAQGADIQYYMLGGFCPLNKKVAYKANYPPVRFCVPWASSLWFEDLRMARVLAGFSALRQTIRTHRLAGIKQFLAWHGVVPTSSSLVQALRETGHSMHDLLSVIHLHWRQNGHWHDEYMDVDSPAHCSVPPELPSSTVAMESPGIPPMPALLTDFVKRRESLPTVLRQLCERLLPLSYASDYQPMANVSDQLAGKVVAEAGYEAQRLDNALPSVGNVLEAVFECSLSAALDSHEFSCQEKVSMTTVLLLVDKCARHVSTCGALEDYESLLVGCDRVPSQLDPDYALPVTVKEAFHGLCSDTLLDVDSIYHGLVTGQQLSASPDLLPLCVHRPSGECRMVRFSQLSRQGFASSKWWRLSGELLYHNLESLAGALGPELCQETVVHVTEFE